MYYLTTLYKDNCLDKLIVYLSDLQLCQLPELPIVTSKALQVVGQISCLLSEPPLHRLSMGLSHVTNQMSHCKLTPQWDMVSALEITHNHKHITIYIGVCYKHTYTPTHTQSHTQTHAHVPTHTHTHTHKYTKIHSQTHILYTHTTIYSNTCKRLHQTKSTCIYKESAHSANIFIIIHTHKRKSTQHHLL